MLLGGHLVKLLAYLFRRFPACGVQRVALLGQCGRRRCACCHPLLQHPGNRALRRSCPEFVDDALQFGNDRLMVWAEGAGRKAQFSADRDHCKLYWSADIFRQVTAGERRPDHHAEALQRANRD